MSIPDVSYYLDDFTDEVLPCGTRLEDWAEWLSKPDECWPHDIPADGDTFSASAIRWADDIVATRVVGGWKLSRFFDGEPSVLAVRYGRGMGWNPDNIIGGPNGEFVDGKLIFPPITPAHIRQWLADHDDECDDEEYIAVGYNEPPVTLLYKAEPPRLIVLGTQQ